MVFSFFYHHLLITLPCYFRVHRAGSQLKIQMSLKCISKHEFLKVHLSDIVTQMIKLSYKLFILFMHSSRRNTKMPSPTPIIKNPNSPATW